MTDKLLTQREVAVMLGVSIKTLQILRRTRKIGFARFGYRTIRFRESQVYEFLKRREQAVISAESIGGVCCR